MEIFKRVVNICLVIVTILLTIISCVWLYFKTLGKDKIPSAVTSTYVTTVVDPFTSETKPAIEARYYENKNGNGYEVVELLFNCYSGVSKQAIYSRGFQLVTYENGWPVLYYYDSYDGESFTTGHEYKWGDPIFFDIDGETCAVKLDGTYTVTSYTPNVLKSLKNCFVGLFTGMDYSDLDNYYDKHVNEYQYDFSSLLSKIGEIIKSSSNGTGESVISLIDLGDFLHVYSVDENGAVSGEPIGANTLINSYFTMQTYYDTRGMVWHKQSMFNSVAGDSQFNITGIEENVDYWRAVSEVKITEQDFVSRYSETENGSFYYLSNSKILELKKYNNVEINIEFDISKLDDRNVLGFDSYAIAGVKVSKLTIRAENEQDFKLSLLSLENTGITKIYTENVNLINENSGVAYEVV